MSTRAKWISGLTLMFSVAGMAQQPKGANGLDHFPVRLCGELSRAVGTGVSVEGMVFLKTQKFTVSVGSGNEKRMKFLEGMLKTAADRATGCFYGQDIPRQGFHGGVFNFDEMAIVPR